MVKLSKELELRIQKIMDSRGIKIDAEALWDSTLNEDENYLQIFGTERPEELTVSEGDVIESLERNTQAELKQKEEDEQKALEEIKKSISPNLEKFYSKLREFVKMISEGYTNALILVGKTATGKTWNTLNVLEETDCKFAYHAGFTTPMALYIYLYNHKDDYIIFFDDTVGILSSEEAMSIMLSALWSTTGDRVVRWSSTSGRLKDIPSFFTITSRIIFCVNRIPRSETAKSVFSRCQHYKLSFTYDELIKIMYEIAKTKHKDLRREERNLIVDFIKENTDYSTIDLNLRTQKKIEEIYLYAKKHKLDWKDLANELIKDRNDVLLKFKHAVENNYSVEDQIKEFIKTSGRQRRTFFRYKRRLKI